MVSIPQEFRDYLIELLEWHLNKFPKSQTQIDFSHIRLNHLHENLCGRRYELNNDTLYYLREAVYDAKQYIEECGIDSVQLSKIDEWVNIQWKNRKP